PLRRDAAGGGLALPDLVAIEHQDLGSRPGQLTGNGEAGEARPADDHVMAAAQWRSLVAALCLALGHGRIVEPARPAGLSDMNATPAEAGAHSRQAVV